MDTIDSNQYIMFIDVITPKTASQGVLANYKPVICGISNGINLEFESISFRNKCDGMWDNSASGYGSWNFDMQGHAIAIKNSEKLIKANYQEVADLAVNRREFWAKMADVNNLIVREGLVRISSYREVADMDTPYSFQLSFVGIGAPVFKSVPNPPTPGKQLVYYGWKDTSSTLTYSEIIAADQFDFDHLQPEITVPFNVSEFKYLWFAIPNGEPVKNYFQDAADAGNQAPIGGDSDLFGSPVLVAGTVDMDFYITNYKTYYDSPEPIRGLTFKTV